MVATVEGQAVAVPPATAFEGRASRPGKRLSFRQAERLARVGSAREVVGGEAEAPVGGMTVMEWEGVRNGIKTVACTEAWAEATEAAMLKPRPNGKPAVPYVVSPTGTLKTRMPRLLDMVAEAGIYPPKADDVAKWLPGGGYHWGSQMRPCLCPECLTDHGGPYRAILWPAHYVSGGLSATCNANRLEADMEAAAKLDPDAAALAEVRWVRERNVGVSGRRVADKVPMKVADPDAWRHDPIRRLKLASRTAMAAIRRHRWSVVTGTVKARVEPRRLRTLGDLADFIELGHRLTSVPGLNGTCAADAWERFMAYPRAARMVPVEWHELKTRGGEEKRPASVPAEVWDAWAGVG
jgi:hypothetical protein